MLGDAAAFAVHQRHPHPQGCLSFGPVFSSDEVSNRDECGKLVGCDCGIVDSGLKFALKICLW